MNTKFNRLIEHLKFIDNSADSKLGFDMCGYFEERNNSIHPCGTACCIEGHAQTIFGERGHDEFADLFNIPHSDWNDITVPDELDGTLEEAIQVLETYRVSGEVVWDNIFQKNEEEELTRLYGDGTK